MMTNNYLDDPNQPRKQALVSALGGTATGPAMGAGPTLPVDGPAELPASPGSGLPGTSPDPGLGAGTMTAPKASPFQSQNQSVRGYLDEAVHAFAPTVKGIKDEAGRKSAVEGYLRDLMPEVEKRGGKMAGIQGENATVDGRIIDFFRDIEGAADPQYLDKTDEVNAGPQRGGMFTGSTISPMLQGDAQSNIQAALQNIGGLAGDSRLQELIKALGGGQ